MIKNANNCRHFNIYEQDNFHAQMSSAWKNLGVLFQYDSQTAANRTYGEVGTHIHP